MHWISIFRRNPFVLPMAVVAGLAIFFVSEGSYWQSVETINDLRGLSTARQNLATLARSLVDAETGQRGYLLTGRKDYLQPYLKGRETSLEALTALDRHYADEPAAKARLQELRALAENKLSGLEKSVQLMTAGQKQAAVDMVLGGSGKHDMDQIRQSTASMVLEQTALRQSTNAELDRTLLLSRYGVAALSAVLMLALVLYLRKSDALASAELARKEAMQAAHDRLEAEVAQRTAQLTDLARHLQNAREDERQRLARNLHDDLGSLLTAAKLDAARIRSRLGADATEAQARLADLVVKLNSSIALGRSIIEDLRPSTLSHLGLDATLGVLGTEFSQRAGIPVHRVFEPVVLKPSVELVVYRLVQEALTNLSKYAHAHNVWIEVKPSVARAGFVQISVRDDGVGFDTAATSRSAFGLMGMRFRVEAEGGSLQVLSKPGQGTRIDAWLPLH
jgi:signal transduction histidine kinase